MRWMSLETLSSKTPGAKKKTGWFKLIEAGERPPVFNFFQYLGEGAKSGGPVASSSKSAAK